MVPEYGNIDELELQFAQDEEREQQKKATRPDTFQIGTAGNPYVAKFKQKVKVGKTQLDAINSG